MYRDRVSIEPPYGGKNLPSKQAKRKRVRTLSLTSDEVATESPGSAKGKEVSGSIRRFESSVRFVPLPACSLPRLA